MVQLDAALQLVCKVQQLCRRGDTMQQLSRCVMVIIIGLVSFADTSRNKTELDKHEG